MPGAVSPDALCVAELIALQQGVLTDVQGSKE